MKLRGFVFFLLLLFSAGSSFAMNRKKTICLDDFVSFFNYRLKKAFENLRDGKIDDAVANIEKYCLKYNDKTLNGSNLMICLDGWLKEARDVEMAIFLSAIYSVRLNESFVNGKAMEGRSAGEYCRLASQYANKGSLVRLATSYGNWFWPMRYGTLK